MKHSRTRECGRLLIAVAVLSWSSVSSALVTPVGPEFRVNTSTSSNQGYPSVARLKDGGFVVAWESGSFGSLGVFGQRYDSVGSPVGGEFHASSALTTARHPQVASLSDGGFVVVYEQNDDVYGTRYDDGGGSSSQFLVNTYTIGVQRVPVVTGLADGGFMVAWTSGGFSGMHQDGDGDGIFAQGYSSSGVTPVGGEFQVNIYTPNDQTDPSVAAVGDGFVVVWRSGPGLDGGGEDGSEEGVFGRRYSADRNPLSSEFQVNTTTLNDQFRPNIAAVGTGSVVGWQSFGIDGQRYDGAGMPVGAEFPIDVQGAAGVDIAGTAGVAYVVVYAGSGDGDGATVLGNRFPLPQGTPFQVNTFTLGHQFMPDVAVTSEGFVVVWQSDDQDGSGTGVYAQRFKFGGFAALASDKSKMKLIDKGDSQRSLVFTVQGAAIDASPGSGIDPLLNGAALHVYNTAGTGDAACFALPSQGWRRARDGSLVYADPAARDGACKKARVKTGKLKVVCTSKRRDVPYTLDEARQGTIAARLVTGRTEYCTEFGAAQVRHDAAGKFVARAVNPDARCPVPPSVCD